MTLLAREELEGNSVSNALLPLPPKLVNSGTSKNAGIPTAAKIDTTLHENQGREN